MSMQLFPDCASPLGTWPCDRAGRWWSWLWCCGAPHDAPGPSTHALIWTHISVILPSTHETQRQGHGSMSGEQLPSSLPSSGQGSPCVSASTAVVLPPTSSRSSDLATSAARDGEGPFGPAEFVT